MMDSNDHNKSKLLVVVPDEVIDEVSFARRTRILAESKNLEILFLGKIQSEDTEPRLRRRLVTLSAIAGCGKSRSHFVTHTLSTWLEIVSKEFNPGDIILCPTRLSNSNTDSHEEERLHNQFGANLIFSTGIVKTRESTHLKQISGPILYWVGIIFILGVSFIVEAEFDLRVLGWMHIAGQAAVVSLEVMLLYVWHRFMLRNSK